jgi:hypothetical protein
VKLTCPKCSQDIPTEDVNVGKDIAYCRGCNESFELSALTHGAELEAGADFSHPPAGAWRRSEGMETVIGATHRSPGLAAAGLAVALFWNGIVSVFVSANTAATLRHLGLQLPAWFPGPKMNGPLMPLGMTIFLWLFLTPFMAVGLVLIGTFLSYLAGHTDVRIANGQAVVFTGVGALGFRRRFDPRDVKDVRIEEGQWRDRNGYPRQTLRILVETREGKEIKFGTSLSAERRKFVAAALRRELRL